MAVATARGYGAFSYRWVGIGLVVLAFILLAVGFFVGIATAIGIVLLVLFVIFLIVGLYLLFAGPGAGWGMRRGMAPAAPNPTLAPGQPGTVTTTQPATVTTTQPAPAAGVASGAAAPRAVSGTSARFCPACGAPVTGQGQYCAACGRALP